MSNETPTSWRFNEASWDMSDVIGWILYRDPKNFGGTLATGDVKRAILYKKAGLVLRELLNVLKSGKLEALRDGKKVPTDEWFLQGPLHHIIEQLLRKSADFRRPDILDRWPLNGAVQLTPELDTSPNVDVRLRIEKLQEAQSAQLDKCLGDDSQEAFASKSAQEFAKLATKTPPRVDEQAAAISAPEASPVPQLPTAPASTEDQIIADTVSAWIPRSGKGGRNRGLSAAILRALEKHTGTSADTLKKRKTLKAKIARAVKNAENLQPDRSPKLGKV